MAEFGEGLQAILAWQHVLAMAIGVVAGVTAGAIPGLSATMAVALFLPLTYGLSPLVAFAVIAGLHNGAAYGGSIPAILLRIPGTPAAVVTTFDGHAMAQQGRAALALRIAVVSSTVGGTVSAIALMVFAPPLARIALAFGPVEIFWVAVFGLASTGVLLGKDPLKGLLAACFGLILGIIGLDHVSGAERYSFGMIELSGGLPLAIVLIALFALPSIWQMAESGSVEGVSAAELKLTGAGDRLRQWPWRRIYPAWVRGSIIGTIVGILPGLGGAVSGLVAYGEHKRASRDPESFGQGNPAGIAVAECANNADNAASLIPALTLGIPGSGVAVIVLAGLLIHGLEPGPQLLSSNPDIVYGYMWAMLFTSLMLLLVGGMLATRLFAQVLRLPPVVLMPLIAGFTVVGAYAYENSIFDVYLMFVLGLFGYALDRLGFPPAPVILGLFLGPKLEFSMRISLMLSQGDWSVFWTRPISQALIALTLLVLFHPLISRAWQRYRHREQTTFPKEDSS